MAQKSTALPTEEEIDQMKLGKMTRLLREKFGMTEDETEEMEEEEARAELKRRIRELQAAAASRRPGQITEMLRQATSNNRKKREGLIQIYDKICEFVDSMNADDKQKMKEFFGQNLQVVLKDVKAFLQNKDCPILVVGEASSGKSSLLNLLLGEDILPVSHLASTSTLCFVRHGIVKKATVYLKGSDPTVIDLGDADRAKKEELASYVHRWGKQEASDVQKVVIEWPLESLQGGICLVDGPGISETEEMDEVVAGVLSSTCAFIYVINSASPLTPASASTTDGSMEDELADGLSCLLKLCQKHHWGDVSQFDLESTMFVCNKWDMKENDKEEKEVRKDYLKKLRDHFPELRDDQVFFLSCEKAVSPAGQLSPEFSRLLDGLDKLLPQSLQRKLELQYQHVAVVLQKASQYVRLKLHSTSGTRRERRKAKDGARWRLENFKKHVWEVFRDLDQLLKATKTEAEKHLKAFLRDEALRERVYQKILNDFPEVHDSEIGSARLITAIVNEIESQLKSNPNSAFNQCVRDADIKLREKFRTEYGQLSQEHNDVIEEMLINSQLPSRFELLGRIAASFFFDTYMLPKIVEPTIRKIKWVQGDLAKNRNKMVARPGNRKKYVIRHFTNQVFDTMTKREGIKSAVNEHLKEPIQYLQACKDAIPKLQRIDKQLMQDETRSEDEISKTYQPKLETVIQLTEELCGFYATDIKKHEFDLAIGKPSSWKPPKEGGQGRVYLVQISEDGGTFMAAVKIPKQLPAGETNASFVREAENLRKLKGLHVVECFGTYRGDNDADGNPCLGLVMEYCPKTLDEEMFQKKENSPAWWGDDREKQAAAFSYTQNLAVQLCEGLRTIHVEGYMHRDLKLVNVLVTSKEVVKLADLGSSKAEKAYARTHDVGTRIYAAPEVLAQKKYNRSADMYSMGLILLEMWYGRTIYYPVDSEYESQFEAAVPLDTRQQLPLPSWDGRAPPIRKWQKLINECLRKIPRERPTARLCRDRIQQMSLQPGAPRAKTKDGQEICLIYQNPSGCRRTTCNYAHVCITPGCGEPHPRWEHNTRQK